MGAAVNRRTFERNPLHGGLAFWTFHLAVSLVDKQ
jgi:hypothetical protein